MVSTEDIGGVSPTAPRYVQRGCRKVAVQLLHVRSRTWFLSIVDQGLVALCNLTLTIAVTRTAGVTALGGFALVSAAQYISLGLFRTLVSEPVLASARWQSRAARGHFAAATYVAALAGAFVSAIVVFLAVPEGGVWWWVCPVTALFVIQDAARYRAYKAIDPKAALISDFTLLSFLVGGLVSFSLLGKLGMGGILVSWLLALAISIFPSRRYLSGNFRKAGLLSWWRVSCRPLAMPLLLDSTAFIVSMYITQYILAAAATAVAVAQIRIVTSFYSPASMVFTGLSMWLMPSLGRASDRMRAKSIQRRASILLTGIAGLMVGAAMVVGPDVCRLVFKTDEVGRTELLLGGVAVWLIALSTPWFSAAKVQSRYAPIAMVRAVTAAPLIGILVFVSSAQTAVGYLSLLAAQCAVLGFVAWIVNRGGEREAFSSG